VLRVRVGRWAMVKSGGGMTDLVQGMRLYIRKKGGGGVWHVDAHSKHANPFFLFLFRIFFGSRSP
jgi:hypothetical protein